MEIPDLLTKGGCRTDVFCTQNSWAIQNNSYHKYIQGGEDPVIFVKELLSYVQSGQVNYDWIIPGDDIVLRMLNEAIDDELLFYKMMPLSKIENRSLLGSKAGFSALCAKYGILTPAFLIYDEQMTEERILSVMKFPFMMKVDQSEGGYGVFLCHDEDEFREKFRGVANKHHLVFQQFIKGYDVNVEVLYRDGELLVQSYSRTMKIMGSFGVSTQRLYYNNAQILPELIRIGRSLGLNGFGNVVFMFDEATCAHYLIEIDLRPNAWMNYGRYFGNDFSKAVSGIVSGTKGVMVADKRYDDTRKLILLYKKDVQRCLLEKDIKGLFGWFTNRDGRWQFIPRHDKKMWRACNRFLLHFLGELVQGKFRKVFGIKSAT